MDRLGPGGRRIRSARAGEGPIANGQFIDVC